MRDPWLFGHWCTTEKQGNLTHSRLLEPSLIPQVFVHGNLSVTTTVIMTVTRERCGLHVYSCLQAGLGNPTKLIARQHHYNLAVRASDCTSHKHCHEHCHYFFIEFMVTERCEPPRERVGGSAWEILVLSTLGFITATSTSTSECVSKYIFSASGV